MMMGFLACLGLALLMAVALLTLWDTQVAVEFCKSQLQDHKKTLNELASQMRWIEQEQVLQETDAAFQKLKVACEQWNPEEDLPCYLVSTPGDQKG